ALCAAILGAAPLLIYNVHRHWLTLGNAAWSAEGFTGKAGLLQEGLAGAGLYASIARDDDETPGRPPAGPVEETVVRLDSSSGAPRTSLFWVGCLVTLALLPVACRYPEARTAAVFALVTFLVSWLMMAFTKGAGASTHHAVLLWPMPHLAVATVFSAAGRRFGLAGKLILGIFASAIAVSSLLVTNHYYAMQIRNGGTSPWTEAFYPLSSALAKMQVNQVCLADWGFADNLRLMHQGRLPLAGAALEDTEEARAYLRRQIHDPNNVFVTHTEGNRIFPRNTEMLLAFARKEGLMGTDVKLFHDRNGRAVIEIFRFVPAPGKKSTAP
ncbi:MAG TPA: hypothetical protein VMZ52_12245, partial [Bryobacteraceae bacterium]|nr:hypothetical protein [Bryobacteraceae bacterium]